MLTYTETNWPCCGFNNNYQPAAIAERTLFVIKDRDYTVSNPEYVNRVSIREKLFDSTDDKSVTDFCSTINRQVYLLIEDNLDEDKFFVEDSFKPFPDDPRKGFLLVYQNEKQRVYHVCEYK